MQSMSDHNLISESQARELIEEEFKKIGPNLIDKVSQKISDAFTKKELHKTLESIQESVEKNNLMISEQVTNFIKQSRQEIVNTNAEYKQHTESFLREIKPLFMQGLEREMASIKDQQLQLDQFKQKLITRENELTSKETSIRLSNSQLQQQSELFQNEKQAFTEKESELSEREEKLEKKIGEFSKRSTKNYNKKKAKLVNLQKLPPKKSKQQQSFCRNWYLHLSAITKTSPASLREYLRAVLLMVLPLY